jgi:hypothetical protein
MWMELLFVLVGNLHPDCLQAIVDNNVSGCIGDGVAWFNRPTFRCWLHSCEKMRERGIHKRSHIGNTTTSVASIFHCRMSWRYQDREATHETSDDQS